MTHLLRLDKLLWLVFLLCSSIGLAAQAHLSSTVIGSGGSSASNASLRILHTFGQSIVGLHETPQYHIWQGFWHQSQRVQLSSTEPVAGDIYSKNLALHCFPNPISKAATVDVFLPELVQVNLTLRDAFGREVLRLLDEEQQVGHSRIAFNAEEITSGWYTLTLSTGDSRINYPIHIVQ